MQSSIIPLEPPHGSIRHFPAHRIVRQVERPSRVVVFLDGNPEVFDSPDHLVAACVKAHEIREAHRAADLAIPAPPPEPPASPVQWMPRRTLRDRLRNWTRDPIIQAALILLLGIPVCQFVLGL